MRPGFGEGFTPKAGGTQKPALTAEQRGAAAGPIDRSTMQSSRGPGGMARPPAGAEGMRGARPASTASMAARVGPNGMAAITKQPAGPAPMGPMATAMGGRPAAAQPQQRFTPPPTSDRHANMQAAFGAPRGGTAPDGTPFADMQLSPRFNQRMFANGGKVMKTGDRSNYGK